MESHFIGTAILDELAQPGRWVEASYTTTSLCILCTCRRSHGTSIRDVWLAGDVLHRDLHIEQWASGDVPPLHADNLHRVDSRHDIELGLEFVEHSFTQTPKTS